MYDRIVRKRTRYTDMYEGVEAKFSVMERAERVLSQLENEHPYFLKCMLPSNVSHGFWLHLPKKFCSLHLPNHDSSIVLVDEWGNEYNTSYLLGRHGLSAGWRGFSISHRLLKGDILIFHLIESFKLKVHIVRVHGPDVIGAALCLMNWNTSDTELDPATEILAEPTSPIVEPSATTEPNPPEQVLETVEPEPIDKDLVNKSPLVEDVTVDDDLFDFLEENLSERDRIFEEVVADSSTDPFVVTESGTNQDQSLDEAVDEVLADDPLVQPVDVVSVASTSTSTPKDAVDKGKEFVSFQATIEEDAPVAESTFVSIQLEAVNSTLNSMQTLLHELKTEQFLYSNSVEKIKEAMESWMKSISRDLAELSKDLNSSIRKSTLRSVQFHEFLSSKIDSLESAFMLKLDSVNAKLATITAILGIREFEESRKSTDHPRKKRTEPDSSRKDKGPVDKRLIH